MEESEFNIESKNSLTELSELRLEIEQANQDFDLKCRLIFGKMHYEHGGREYEVGVSRAHLRLTLEGCESKLRDVFGESVLGAIEEEKSVEKHASLEAATSLSATADAGAIGKAGGSAAFAGTRKYKQSQKTVHLPVSARPNDSWEIKPQTIGGRRNQVIEGTAIPNAHLCSIARKHGGNRLAIVGELQVSKRALRVSAQGGNKLGRTMNEWQNKDAIVSQILKRAIQREATTISTNREVSTVTISRCDVLEN